MSDYISAAPGWVAKVAEGSYRSVVGFDADSAAPVILPRPDLGDEGTPDVQAVFFDPEKVPGAPA
jgi:hypothetical protein